RPSYRRGGAPQASLAPPGVLSALGGRGLGGRGAGVVAGPFFRGAGPLAAVGFLTALGAWALGRSVPVLVAGLLLGALIPFTLLVVLPTNKRLLDPALDPPSTEAASLLTRWGRLHAVRSVARAVAFVLLALDLAAAF